MKKILAGLVLATMTAGAAFAGSHSVRMGTEGAYPPYNFLNEANEVDGFERELGDELCKRAELACTWVTNDWDSIIPNLVSGNYDTIIAGMSITAERAEVIDFTSEYFPPDPSAYVAVKGAAGIGDIVAAQKSTIQASYVASSDQTVVEFATPDDALAAIKSGEADSVLADKAYLAPIVKESNGDLIFVGEDVNIGGGIGMGVRKSDGALKGKMDAAIASMKADGSLNAMIAKWFDGKEGGF